MGDNLSFSKYIVNVSALRRNCFAIKNLLKDGVKLCAVVKSNGYGVGACLVAKNICDIVDCFAVANLSEGIALRKAKISNEIIVLCPTNFDKISHYSSNNLTAVAESKVDSINLSREVFRPIKVQIKADTGMHRFGIYNFNDFLDSIAILKSNKNICISGLYSHLATKQNNVEFISEQNDRFNIFCSLFLESVDGNLDIHISNSNATIYHNNLNYNMVRCGFALYGMDRQNNLEPVIEIKSKIVSIKNISKNQSVGYDRTFIAGKDMVVGIVPLGYADGIDRRLSNNGCVIINNNYVPIIGRVCMDVFMVDLTGIKAKVNDEVIILGKEKDKEILLSDIAGWINASEYDTLVHLNNKRMKIIIKKD